MARASIRPAGARLTRDAPPGSLKFRCIEITATVANGGAWGQGFWGTGWDPTNLPLKLQTIKARGANCVKVGPPSTGPGTGSIADATLRSRMQQFWTWCRQYGLKVYYVAQGCSQFTGTDNTDASAYGNTMAVNVAYVCKILSWMQQDAPDLIIGVDLANEFNNYGSPANWGSSTTSSSLGKYWSGTARWQSDCQYLMLQARQACKFPLTMSNFMAYKTNWATDYGLGLQIALGCDFHDIHPYYTQESPLQATDQYPGATESAALKTRIGYLGRYFAGEIGGNVNSTAANFALLMNGLGDMARDPHCLGINYLGLTTYQASSDFGMYPDTTPFVTMSPRTQVTVPFLSWPAGS